jgi:hypothetical protein
MLFLHRLALKLGIWDVPALAAAMPVDTLYGWMGYYQLEPWGDEWLRSAVALSQFQNVHRCKNKPRSQPADFMPVDKRAQTPAQILAVLNSIPR